MELSKNKKINISVVVSLLALVVSFLTSFLFTKFLLHQPQIGSVRYGLKTTVDSLVSFVSILTFGMSSTFIRFHNKYRNKEKAVFAAFNLITTIVALIILAFGAIICILTLNGHILKVGEGAYTEEQVHEFILILIVTISYVALSVILDNNKFYLESTKHVILVRIINLLILTAYPLISIPIVLSGKGMVAVTIVYASSYIVGFLFYLFYRIFKCKEKTVFIYKGIEKSIVKEISVFIIFVILTVCVETLNHSVDKIILTVGFSAASLSTVYQLSVIVNQVMILFSDTIYAPILPFIADDIEKGNTKEIQKTYDSVSFILLLLGFLLLSGFVACGREFINFWVGEELIESERNLLFWFTVISLTSLPLYVTGKFSTVIHRIANKHKESSVIYLLSFLLHLVITFSLLWLVGIWACIIGTSISMLAIGIAFYFVNKKYINLSEKEYTKNLLFILLATVVTIGISIILKFFVFDHLNIGCTAMFFIKGIIAVLLFGGIIFIVYRKNLFKLIKQVSRKK